MFILEKLIGIVAPHQCMICGEEGAVVCDWCLPDLAQPLPARCFRCQAASANSRVCKKCRRTSKLKHVWVRAEYEKDVKQLVHDFKFERKQAAAAPIAKLMAEALPFLSPDTVVVHIPTATSRVRRRGYDPAELIAKALAKELSLRHQTLLRRVTQTRQVGAKRTERLRQMQDAFRATNVAVKPSSVLLIDDLTTTGATLESAAKCLHGAGIKTINVAVFAQKQ